MKQDLRLFPRLSDRLMLFGILKEESIEGIEPLLDWFKEE